MPRKKVTPESITVAKRFARAYEELRYRGMVNTKTNFAKELDMEVSNITRLEKNENYEPSISNLLILINKFNVSPIWLLTGEGDFFWKDKTLHK